jgi:hypothetical protein
MKIYVLRVIRFSGLMYLEDGYVTNEIWVVRLNFRSVGEQGFVDICLSL